MAANLRTVPFVAQTTCEVSLVFGFQFSFFQFLKMAFGSFFRFLAHWVTINVQYIRYSALCLRPSQNSSGCEQPSPRLTARPLLLSLCSLLLAFCSLAQQVGQPLPNIAVNGEMWTGLGNQTTSLFPLLSSLKPADFPNENMCSAVFQIRYGKFDYFSGGDVQGVIRFGAPAWHDVETPIAQVVGPVDVQLVDHHGYPDSQNGALLTRLQPRVMVVPSWASSHPGKDVLERMFSDEYYKEPRDVFMTNLLPEAKTTIADLLPRLKSEGGHVVIRVEKGGQRFRVLVLDDTTETLVVKSIEGPYQTR